MRMSFGILLVSTLLGLSLARSPRAPGTECPEKCALAFRCNPYYSEGLIWALDGGICKVFANGCVYASAKCGRRNDCLAPFVDSNQSECQSKCASGCESQPEDRVCGWFPKLSKEGTAGDEQLEFRNQCSLDEYSCREGKPYGSVSPAPCT